MKHYTEVKQAAEEPSQPKHTPEAEALADAILKAAGSGLRHYSVAKTREAIFVTAQAGIDDVRAALLSDLEDAVFELEQWVSVHPDESDRTREIIASARASIAKATGQQLKNAA